MRPSPPRLVHVVGVPIDLGGGRRGVDMGPSAVRIAGLGERITAMGFRLTDKGDLSVPIAETRAVRDSRKRYVREIAQVCARLYRTVHSSYRAGALPVTLGGDHSLAVGSVAASADVAAERGKPLGLLWVDAHGDMNTPATTRSGNVHGMPLAALLGQEPAELSRIGQRFPAVRADKTVLVGLRDLDPLEKERIRASKIHVFTMQDVDARGIAWVMKRALSLAGRGTAGVHVSLDMDVCDPSIAPGVGTPVKGGLDYREAHTAMELVASSGKLVALDLVEINPVLDVRNQTAILGVELVQSALGQRII
jgi:arginase